MENNQNKKLAYPDLTDPDHVYKGLIGHGLFSEKLPPCFNSLDLKEWNCEEFLKPEFNKYKDHACINFNSQRDTNVPRTMSIPHPESYIYLCTFLKDHWIDINQLIGGKIPTKKKSFIHVRHIADTGKIFEMSYKGHSSVSPEPFDELYRLDPMGKEHEQEIESEYLLTSKYIVHADISNCFSSIYSHSIEWVIDGKERAQSYNSDDCSWAKKLDKRVRGLKGNETNGILIGPDVSNIISELILTEVDDQLDKKGFSNYIRNIDDYKYFARSEDNAEEFLSELAKQLERVELKLNDKKTKVTRISDEDIHWTSLLEQFFIEREDASIKSINSFIDYAVGLQKEFKTSAVINYAIKIISKKDINQRDRYLYVRKMLNLAKEFPYLVPLLEENVLSKFNYLHIKKDLGLFLNFLYKETQRKYLPDISSYCLYLALKFKVEIDKELIQQEKIVDRDDCIELAMTFEYLKQKQQCNSVIKEHAKKLLNKHIIEIDKKWLFVYESLSLEDLKTNQHDKIKFLIALKESGISFIKF